MHPLMLSSGSGALARNAIGTVVVIGMGVATLVGAFSDSMFLCVHHEIIPY